ncbi:ATP-binding protein [Streptomyces sp. WAC00288]|uniref:ATP-binding protein n=1 Tax=Streptomyces cinereoruber TaxID=67260 RepID=A0ABX6BRM1_9ACTN|nr:ATP-binding protein [Streptomyces sp. WAC00288]PVC69775.1 ATP-binding protein [Streptomyces sp. CS081A]QEV36571.1 ATP-binding protein [Streptomyces cinereoruber]
MVDGADRRAGREAALSVSGVFQGSLDIAAARDLARRFLADVQAVHGLPVRESTTDIVQLVVSELMTNADKYAPGASLLALDAASGAIEVSVWDSNPTPPAILPPDPARIGQHGLEIVIRLARGFTVHRTPLGKRITATIALTDDPMVSGV